MLLKEKDIRSNTPLMWKTIHSIVDWLLPRMCVLCGYPTLHTHSFCDKCQNDLPILPHGCQQCAHFLRFTPNEFSQNPLKCGTCLNHPPAFDLTYALFPYAKPINRLITQLKFHHQLTYAKALGQLMAERIVNRWYLGKPLPDLIIPIPLHPSRLRERGFNQALEMTRPIAKMLAMPIDYQGVRRIKPTLAQSGLTQDARKHNIRHAFSATRDYSGLTIALIDDVITTGFTVMECSRILKDNGASRIHVWCAARKG